MRTDFWTKERIATLKRLWAQGKSAGAIAKMLGGVSRAAVLGKIFRLRLGAAEKSAKKTREKAKAADQKRHRIPQQDQPARRRGVAPEIAAKASGPSGRKSLLELTNKCCRWPHGQPGTKNFFFCGASGADLENGLPYCPQHVRRAYVVPPENTGATRPATSLTPWRVVSRAA
jgi:GcrA cell cycle regulator